MQTAAFQRAQKWKFNFNDWWTGWDFFLQKMSQNETLSGCQSFCKPPPVQYQKVPAWFLQKNNNIFFPPFFTFAEFCCSSVSCSVDHTSPVLPPDSAATALNITSMSTFCFWGGGCWISARRFTPTLSDRASPSHSWPPGGRQGRSVSCLNFHPSKRSQHWLPIKTRLRLHFRSWLWFFFSFSF